MASLDTNVLVRWLMDDDPAQAGIVRQLLATALEHHERLHIPVTVALELEWVLRSKYGCTKPDVLTAFTALLEARELVFDHEPAVEQALYLYRHGSADFGDCMHVAIGSTADHSPLLTFDRKASRLAGARLLV